MRKFLGLAKSIIPAEKWLPAEYAINKMWMGFFITFKPQRIKSHSAHGFTLGGRQKDLSNSSNRFPRLMRQHGSDAPVLSCNQSLPPSPCSIRLRTSHCHSRSPDGSLRANPSYCARWCQKAVLATLRQCPEPFCHERCRNSTLEINDGISIRQGIPGEFVWNEN